MAMTLGKQFLDLVLLLLAAFVLCVVGVGAFWLADRYRLNAIWVFVCWNSIILMPMFFKKFRGHLKRPSFIVFLLVWAVFHGFIVVGLMRWLPFVYCVPVILIELTLGFLVADWLFGVLPSETGREAGS
jgi:hypothetical protein